MNWIEIDKILYRVIERHTTVEGMYAEAQKTFKWDIDQARAAIDPLLKRHGSIQPVADKPKRATKRKVK